MSKLPFHERVLRRDRGKSFSQVEAEDANPKLLTKPKAKTPPTPYESESQRVSNAKERKNKAQANWLIEQAAKGNISPEDLLHQQE